MYLKDSKNILFKSTEKAMGILNLPIHGPQFLEEVKNVRRRLIFKSLFLDCLLAKEALHCGFMKCLESVQHLTNIPNIMKKQIMKTMDKFVEEPKLRDPMFKADINVDVEDFLNSCDFLGGTQVVKVMFFFFFCFTYTQIAKKIMAPI